MPPKLYIQTRNAALTRMLKTFLEADGPVDHTGALAELAALEKSYRYDMGLLEDRLPGVAGLYELINETMLQLPYHVQVTTNTSEDVELTDI